VPEYVELCRMDESELRRVKDFVIQNQHAKVQFLEPTNLAGVDLDQIVQINPKSVEFYPVESQKPKVGDGLNKSALITFYNFDLPGKTSEEKFLKKVRQWTKSIHAEFLEYDQSKKSLTINVHHF